MRTSASSAVVEDVLDLSAALAHMGGDADLLAVAGLLLQDYPNQLSSIRAAVVNHDGKLLDRAAHKLKGSLGIFAAKQASDAALSLEMLAKGGDLTRADETSKKPSNASHRHWKSYLPTPLNEGRRKRVALAQRLWADASPCEQDEAVASLSASTVGWGMSFDQIASSNTLPRGVMWI